MQELLRSESLVHIIGIDNVNDYYDVSIKEYRLQQIEDLALQHPESTWTFIKGSIADKELIASVFEEYKPSIVVNLAAQADVRYSITNSDVYIESSLNGFYNILLGLNWGQTLGKDSGSLQNSIKYFTKRNKYLIKGG